MDGEDGEDLVYVMEGLGCLVSAKYSDFVSRFY